MRQYGEHSAQRPAPATAIPRNTSTTNFPELLQRERGPRAPQSRQSSSRFSLSSSRKSRSNNSENSQILYMSNGKGKARRVNHSLSSIENTPEAAEDSKHHKPVAGLSQNIIDHEIFEWQFVCQTGRPYWWSPESEHTRLGKALATLAAKKHSKIWMREIDAKPKADYATQRRAVSDNYLTDPSEVHDLAQIVAVQLLSACFTLPPDTSRTYPSSTTGDNQDLPLRDRPMISSLRMHTHFRYSPSFGHEGQNNSPTQGWPGTYDGPSLNVSPPRLGDRRSRSQSGCLRKHRQGSSDSENDAQNSVYDVENDSSDRRSYNSDLDPASTGWPRQGVHDPSCTTNRGNPAPRRSCARKSYSSHGDDEEDQRLTGQESRGKYGLHPVFYSEPHPVFIQPARELVVKRWRSFKQRISGSLYGSLPVRASDDQRSVSESPSSIDSSPAMSSDGRARRRRAQERGDISSVDSVAHNNTPVDSMPNSRSASPSTGAASVPVITRTSGRYSSRSQSIPLSAPATIAVPYAREEYGHHLRASVGSARSYASRASGHRRSMLSEVFTPGDFFLEAKYARGTLSPAGSALASPGEPAIAERSSIGNVSNDAAAESFQFTVPDLRGLPSLKRTSTTGTQVFTPSEDGVELNGLPVGVPKDVFAVNSGRRERTYL